MNANHKRRQQQQKIVQSQCVKHDALTFFNLLTDPEIFGVLESLLPTHRERLFPPTETLSMFLAQAMSADSSCQNIVNHVATARFFYGLPLCSTATGAYCRARQRLPVEMVSTLVKATAKRLDEHVPDVWRWQGRPVRIVDGTTVTLPDTPENQAVYPQQKSQAPGLGFPICRIVGITCWSTGALMNAAMGPYKGKGSSEHTLFRQLLPGIDAGDILLGDSLYGSFFGLAQCIERHIDILFEQNGARKLKTDFRNGIRLGPKDHIIQIKKPAQRPDWMSVDEYNASPEEISIREFYCDKKVLITTLLDPITYPKNALKKLYRSRWHVELDLRNIKSILGMERLSCRTPDMAEKEMWVYFLAYNLVRTLMAQGAEGANVTPRQISFKHTVQLWLAWINRTSHSDKIFNMDAFFELVAENQVGERPGRVEPRAVKRRPKPYSLLTKPRHVAQSQILKHGHPPKQREWKRTAA